jgi:hypothetical protein
MPVLSMTSTLKIVAAAAEEEEEEAVPTPVN